MPIAAFVSPRGNQPQHVDLALAEAGHRLRQRPGRRPGREALEQPTGQRRSQHRVAPRDGAHRVDEAGGRDVLEEEAAGPGPDGGVDVLVEVERREREHPDLRAAARGGAGSPRCRRAAASARPSGRRPAACRGRRRAPRARRRPDPRPRIPARSRIRAKPLRTSSWSSTTTTRSSLTPTPPARSRAPRTRAVHRARVRRSRRTWKRVRACPPGRGRRTRSGHPAVVDHLDPHVIVAVGERRPRPAWPPRGGARWSAPPARCGTPRGRPRRGSGRGSPATASVAVDPGRRASSMSAGTASRPGCGSSAPGSSTSRSIATTRRISASASAPVARIVAERSPGELRVVVDDLLGGPGLHHHHAHRVGHDVVQLAGDAGPLLDHGGHRLLGGGRPPRRSPAASTPAPARSSSSQPERRPPTRS